MKRVLNILVLTVLAASAIAQTGGVSITKDGPGSPHPSAILDVESTNQGVLVPRVSAAFVQNDNPLDEATAHGLLVYVADDAAPDGRGYYYFDPAANSNQGDWLKLGNPGIWDTDGTNTFLKTAFETGDVGIGTSTPSTKLHVTGDGLFQSGSATATLKLESEEISGLDPEYPFALQLGGASQFWSLQDLNDGAQRLTLGHTQQSGLAYFDYSNSKVGLGTTRSEFQINAHANIGIYNNASTGSTYPDNAPTLYFRAIDVPVQVLTQGGTVTLNQNFTDHLRLGYEDSGAESAISFFDFSAQVRVNGSVVQTSDARLKRNILPLTSALSKILALNGYQYYWKNPKQGQRKQIGFVAQDVEQVIPELVHQDMEGTKSVDYISVIPVLVEAIKQQQDQIEELKQEVAALKQK